MQESLSHHDERDTLAAPDTAIRDCIVVGAGLSGLVAARNLVRAGYRILVLEAGTSIGGRMHRRMLASGAWADLGGQWVGPTQTRILSLLEEYGVERFASPTSGRTVCCFDDRRFEFNGFFQGFPEGDPPGVEEQEWRDAMDGWKKFETLSSSFPDGSPQNHPDAAELDAQTFADWIKAHLRTRFGRWYFESMSRAVGFLGPAESTEVSLLHVAWGQHVAPQSEHPEAELLHGGAGQIPELISREFTASLRTNAIVTTISHGQDGVEVRWSTPSGTTNEARARVAILAMPPSAADAITFVPPLPTARVALGRQMRMGRCAKVLISYQTPFWRAHGLAGLGIGNRSWVELCADSSDPRTDVGILVAFVVGDRYTRWSALASDARREAILDDIEAYFGLEARTPVSYDEADWSREEFIGGAFSAYMPPGAWTSCGRALVEPVGCVHWAGTEAAMRWPGFFDGAVRAGEAAADHVRAFLSDH